MPALPHPRTLITALIDSLSFSTASLPSKKIDNSRSDHIRNYNPLLDASPHTKSLLLTLHALYPTHVLPALDLLDRRLIIKLTLSDNSAQQTSGVNKSDKSKGTDKDKQNDSLRDSDGTRISVFYVPSTVQTTHRRRAAPAGSSLSGDATASSASQATASTTLYEVRIQAWNCTCSAFTYAALPTLLKPVATDPVSISNRLNSNSDYAEMAEGDNEQRDNSNNSDWRALAKDQTRRYRAPERPSIIEKPSVEDSHSSGWSFGGGTKRNDGSAAANEHAETPVCKHLLACVLAERCSAFAERVEERVVSRADMAAWAAGWSAW